ncbi:D-alanyl-D-alanine carboxypeptidase family protein [Coralliovum pocilloporae]|uniref:D-alanyl-D-alanine carboxypeptidase family protein n=1 Tax=Coralliovum pocilloporae TaxID=3066369 RepID=UPI003307798A
MRRILKAACIAGASLSITGTAIVTSQTEASANPKYASFVIDHKTGKVLHSRNADALRYPASLTKMMTLYVLFEDIEKGRFSLNSRFKVSAHAASQPPSKLGLRRGKTIRVRDAIRALVTKSANDVAVVVAENVSGSEHAFARRMTQTARSLGMSRTTFANASGLPNSKQRTTARDMAKLGRSLQDRFPTYYKFFSTRSFTYGKRRYRNHNRLLGRVKGVDGIKTGYIRASGFNLVTSVKRNGRHIVGVVMGGKTGRSRDRHMAKLIAANLPKASRGKRTSPLLIASATSRIALPKTAPVPARRSVETVLASKASAPKAVALKLPAITPETKPVLATPPVKIAAVPTPKAPLLSAEAVPTPAPAAVKQAPVETQRAGWVIQVGAAPTEAGALSLLSKARKVGGGALRKAESFTETVDKNDETLYRARFAGFRGKKQAWAACKTLKRKRHACFAVQL